MTQEELITKQQLRIEELESDKKENKIVLSHIFNKFYGVGQPLNDNILKFNKDQMAWCFHLYTLTNNLRK